MTEKKKSCRGGVRPGAGRKPDQVPRKYFQVRMSEEERKIFKSLGGSRWLQATLRAHKEVSAELSSTTAGPEKES